MAILDLLFGKKDSTDVKVEPKATVETKVVVKEQKPSVQDTPEVVDGDQPLVGK